MCDASDYAVGAVLGQQIDKKPTAIWYASKTLSEAQMNYTMTENELLEVAYALEKFRPYILGSKICYLYRSCNIKVLVFQEGDKATIDTMGVASSRVWLGD